MADEQAPYHTTTPAPTILQAAHACRERVFHVTGKLNELLGGVRAGEIDSRSAQKRCRRLSHELRAAADELEGTSPD